MSDRSAGASRQLLSRIPEVLCAAGLATWWWATAVSNNPTQSFERLRRRYDPLGLALPDWRFFAPNPAMHDYHVVYRLVSEDGRPTPWQHVSPLRGPRPWHQIVFHPGKRRGKALFDVVSALVMLANTMPLERLSGTPHYRLLEGFVGREVRARHGLRERSTGFQFAVLQHAGFDEEPDPTYLLVSTLLPLTAAEGSLVTGDSSNH